MKKRKRKETERTETMMQEVPKEDIPNTNTEISKIKSDIVRAKNLLKDRCTVVSIKQFLI